SKGGVILAERTIHANEDLLRKVFSRAVTGGEPVSQVVDAPRVLAHDLCPGLLIALHTTLNQFSIDRCQREFCSHPVAFSLSTRLAFLSYGEVFQPRKRDGD